MLKIREAERSDLLAIAEIHVACWRSAYRGMISDAIIDAVTIEERRSLWERWAWEPGVHITVAQRAAGVVGFCRLSPARDVEHPPPNFAEVTHLYVSPPEIGGGVGHGLFTEALEWAHGLKYRGLLLWVLEQNVAARRFYASHGLLLDGGRHTEPEWLGAGVFEVRYRVSFPEGNA